MEKLSIIPRKVSSLNEIFDKYIAFFFDMDGVLVFHIFSFYGYIKSIIKSGGEMKRFLML